MTKTIRAQALRLFFTYGLLTALCVWQSHFILGGIESNPYLNLLIIGVFIFGSILSAKALWDLRNDVVAYTALKSVFDDTHGRTIAPYSIEEVKMLCKKPGIVYSSSKMLGHVFDLTLDELLRGQQMRISVATMQNLISTIDARISHQRSLTGYLSSLSIFLGLIGTFIGLMEMVGSVGGIIGGLANSDAGSTDTMRQLIRNLEAPLTGMAQGFSASLFGLFGSLMLGLASRFVSIAIHSVREEFEGWLAGISQIENDSGGTAAVGPQSSGLNLLLQRVAGMVRLNTERLEQQIETVERASRQFERAALTEQQALQALARVDHLQAEVASLREDMSRHSNALRFGVLDAFERLSRSAQEQQNLALADLARLRAGQGQTDSILLQLASAHERFERSTQDQNASTLSELGKIASMQELADASIGQLAETQTQLLRLSDARYDATQSELAKIRSAQNEAERELGQIAAAQERAGRAGEDRQTATLAELAQMRATQAQAESILSNIAANQAAQPEQGTVTAIVTQAVAASLGELAQSIDQSVRSLTREIAHLADEQRRTTSAMSRGPDEEFRREIKEMSRNLQHGINAGILEVAQTLEGTFAAYTEILRDMGSERHANTADNGKISRSV